MTSFVADEKGFLKYCKKKNTAPEPQFELPIEDSVKDKIVERFKNICDQRNISINDLAVRSKTTPSTAYSMMDRSRQDLSIRTVEKFCAGLNISLKEFFSDPLFDETPKI